MDRATQNMQDKQQLMAFFALVSPKEELTSIAVEADYIVEVIHFPEKIFPFPNGLFFVEGLIHFHDRIISLINVKKQLFFMEETYSDDAQMAVTKYHNNYFGLMIDEIQGIQQVADSEIHPVAADTGVRNQLIKALIIDPDSWQLSKHLNMEAILQNDNQEEYIRQEERSQLTVSQEIKQYQDQYLLFIINNQQYAVHIDQVQEVVGSLTINGTRYKDELCAGVISLRGKRIKVIKRTIISGSDAAESSSKNAQQIIILTHEDTSYAMRIDQLVSLEFIPRSAIMSVPASAKQGFTGIFTDHRQQEVLFIDPSVFVSEYELGIIDACTSHAGTKNKDRINIDNNQQRSDDIENSYLLIYVGEQFAISLNNVKEVLPYDIIHPVPASNPGHLGIINRHEQIIPLISLNKFFELPQNEDNLERQIVIVSNGEKKIGLVVEQIRSILRQQKTYKISAIPPKFSMWRACFDHILNLANKDKTSHILTLNIHNLLEEYLL